MTQSMPALRRQVVEYGRRLYQRNYIGAAEGNISVRLDRSRILITPAGINKGYLKPSDMVVLSVGGRKLSGRLKASSESDLHLAIYARRGDIGAICHAHPIYATACSVAGIALNKFILPELISLLGVVPLAEYGAPGTPELAEKASRLIGNHDAILLRNHGVLTVGVDLEDAFNKLETVERSAQVFVVARSIGRPRTLPKKIAQKLPGFGRAQLQLSRTRNAGKK